jgi:hypothetical protein
VRHRAGLDGGGVYRESNSCRPGRDLVTAASHATRGLCNLSEELHALHVTTECACQRLNIPHCGAGLEGSTASHSYVAAQGTFLCYGLRSPVHRLHHTSQRVHILTTYRISILEFILILFLHHTVTRQNVVFASNLRATGL